MAIQRSIAASRIAAPAASSFVPAPAPRVSMRAPERTLPSSIVPMGKPRFRIDESVAAQNPLPPGTGGTSTAGAGQGSLTGKASPVPSPDSGPDQPYQQTDDVPPEEGEENPEDADNEDTYEGESTFPVAASHVRNGRVCTVAYCRDGRGNFTPVTSRVRVPGTSRIAGPVDFGAESTSPTLNMALVKTVQVLAQKAKGVGQREGVRQVVNRAREGDQNAMAIIVMARENAQKGNPLAKQAFQLIREYIDANPMSDMGADKLDKTGPKSWAHIWLANGPPLTNTRIRSFMSSFGSDEEAESFLYAAMHWRDDDMGEDESGVVDMGRAVGYARAIQKVRMPNSRISDFCPPAGWELGE